MVTSSDDEIPPRSTDLDGWRRAVVEGRIARFRLESVVGAIQDLVPHTDKSVLNPMAKHLSDCMLNMLRGLVGRNHPNHGLDIIERVHSQLWEAILQPKSADGRGLRAAFAPRLRFRLADALIYEKRKREGLIVDTTATNRGPVDEITPRTVSLHSSVPSEPSHIDEHLDVETALEAIADPKKRSAFRLHMDGVPAKSTKSLSISKALGISEKTARLWIEEAQELLKKTLGDRT
jgi:DNA-directed RNA polymerase specialized sigma24 family protein